MAKIKCPQCAHLNDGKTTHCSRCETPLPKVAFKNTPRKPAPAQKANQAFFRRGQVVNQRYTVLDLIGRGGMGCIYKVHDNVLGEDLALKALLPQFVKNKMVVDRFLNEARITRKLAHQNIVRVHDIGMTDKGIFISMEYVQGDSLRGVLEKLPPGERMPVRQALYIVDQLCVALEYAHQYTIHRDIKPENIMITRDNQIKLMDFGISKLMATQTATSASMIMGTPYYMSPEQQRSSRDVDARADIYSIGVVLYELLTGNLPTGVPRPASEMTRDVPPALDEIVRRCVEPELGKRFASVAELRAAIRPVLQMLDEGKDGMRALSHSPGASIWQRLLPPRQHALAAASIVAVLLVVSAGLWMLERWTSDITAAAIDMDAALVPGQSAQYMEINAMMDTVRAHVASVGTLDRTQRNWVETAQSLREQAQVMAREGDAAAVIRAAEALQYYLAALMTPENMVFVPPGHVAVDNETLYVPAFFIDRTEVTLSQFATFSLNVEDGWPMLPQMQQAAEHYPEHPVSYVAWFDAQAYAAWQGKMLPTRAQWARAAYGDSDGSDVYPWGEDWQADSANIQTEHTRSVRSFSDDVVWSGCYDMAGNVMEWTRSRAGTANDTPPDFGDELLVCGGSFLYVQPLRDAVARPFETRAADLGFRCVLEIALTPHHVDKIVAAAK